MSEQIDIENEIQLDEIISEETQKGKGIVGLGVEIHAYHSAKIKEKVDDMAAEISQRQDRIKLLHEIIQAFNRLTNEKDGIDLTNEPELQKKLEIARQLGVEIPADLQKFTNRESAYIIENLHLSADDFDRENKTQSQKMQVLIQESDRLLMLVNFLLKSDDRTKRGVAENLK